MTTVVETERPYRPWLFLAVAGIVVLFLAASSAPTPLYVVYQQAWGFSKSTLTVVFAMYVFTLLTSVLVVGALSDHVGRRPVLAGAIVFEAVAVVVFLTAGDVSGLLVARAVQGLATGAAITTLAATLVDLSPSRAAPANGLTPLVGLAVGAVGCGALVEYAPAPTHLVWALLLVGLVLSLLVLTRLPETSTRRAGAWGSLRPRVGVPRRLRADFLMIVPVLVASWALGGLYLSLGPSVAAELLGLRSHLVGGLVVTLLCGTGAATAGVLRHRAPSSLLVPAGGLLALGTLVTFAGLTGGSAWAAAGGTLVAGVGFGAASLACFGTLGRIAGPDERGELFAVAYVVAYFAFSIPALAAGAATTIAGLRPTTEIYGAAVAVLGVVAVVARVIVRLREDRRPPVHCF